MSKINILNPEVFNMIAAGEVVERPASVVKELVENSIDAGATEIFVTVFGGGLSRVQVSDNGVGVLPDDVRSAFLPHATSKLKNIDDLDTLSSLGFRGEALASIASVSEVTMISRAKGLDEASKISLKGGVITEERRDSRAEGTIISVDNLFFNTPARAKFMKSASAEEKAVLSIIQKLALANPELALSLDNEDKNLFSQEGGSLADSICAVYGVETLDGMLNISSKAGDIRVGGYSSRADFSRPTRVWQTFIVNGRAVECKELSLALDKAYEHYMVKRCYPACVLDILVPFEDVDVNVHPRKTEVRFRNKNAVFSAVYNAVSDALASADTLSTVNLGRGDGANYTAENDLNRDAINGVFGSNPQDGAGNFSQNSAELTENVGKNSNCAAENASNQDENAAAQADYLERRKQAAYSQIGIDTRSLFSVGERPSGVYSSRTQSNRGNSSLSNDVKSAETGVASDILIEYLTNSFDDKSGSKSYDGKSTSANDSQNFDESQVGNKTVVSKNGSFVFDGVIVGQLFETYLVVERGDVAYIIDQHAAHERILYEKLIKKLDERQLTAQSLLVPYTFRLSGLEADYLEKILPSLNAYGFEIEKKADYYCIYAVPELVSSMDFKVFLSELFKNMLNGKDIELKELLRDRICQQACKAAIKGGDSLNREQIEDVLASLIDRDGNLPTKCPHGRPAVVAVKKSDVEKLFKRIV